MSLTEMLPDYINACFTGLWVQSQEPDEAEREIAQLARDKDWKIAVWDVAGGLRFPNAPHDASNVGAGDPLAVLRAVPSLAQKDGTALLVLHNFHRFLNNPEVVQTAFAQLVAGKSQRTFLIVIAPVVQIPIELEKLFVILEHPLPDLEQLQRIAREMDGDSPNDSFIGNDLREAIDASTGLTRYEAEGAFALSLARHGSIQAPAIWELKTQTLKKSGLVALYRGREGFGQLGGSPALKVFCMRALMHQTGRIVKPKGVLLLGVPGVGKSAFAKALGNEACRPTLVLDIGALYGSLVGATEANIRQALRIVDAMAPCICFIDEVEKALAGLGSNGDSGVSSRLFGTFLSWLSDRDSDVFVVCTSNDVSKLPPEFSRAERFDGIFFLDLPTRDEKDAIWKLYRGLFDVAPSEPQPEDTDWTGAEIRSCCRLASLLDVPLSRAATNVVPVAVMAGEQVERLRTWASGRCLSAAESGIYTRTAPASAKSGRRVTRGSGNN